MSCVAPYVVELLPVQEDLDVIMAITGREMLRGVLQHGTSSWKVRLCVAALRARVVTSPG